MTATVHIVEPGGRGGIRQHAAAVAAAVDQAGATVVLHTAAGAEDVPLPATVARRVCFWPFPSVRPRFLRRAAFVAGWLAAGVPGCLARVRPGDIVHVEGRFRPLLLVPLVAGTRMRRCRVGFSPHTTFSRRAGYRGRAEQGLVRWLAHHVDAVFALSDHDRAVMAGWGISAVRVPLAVGDLAMRPDRALVQAWRHRWGGRPVVLFAGHLRIDKGLDLAVAAAAQWEPDARLAVVGEDLGVLAAAVRKAAAGGVELVVDEGYQPLDRLVAAIAAADVVICPYRVASTSAVLALAAALGRPTVATDVGGLADVATVTVSPDADAGALAAAVDKALAIGAVPPARPEPLELARIYLAAYP